MYAAYLTEYIKELIRKTNNDKRLVKQFIVDECNESNDKINSIYSIEDHNDSCLKGLYHKYPSKVLIFPTQKCLGCCRFCFRKNTRTEEPLTDLEFEEVIKYIENDNQITEVIFSGGDPFAIDEKKLIYMLNRVKQIEHILITRIHTRVLTYEPNLINKYIIENIKVGKPTFMVFHINSHLEITDIVKEKIDLLTQNGILCYSQTALLKDINDNYNDLSSLFIELLKIKIKPYYLFHPDRVKGTGHFYITLEKGKQLYNSLFNHISGLAMPIYLFNVPNGNGHCIVDLGNIIKNKDEYKITTWDKNEIIYTEK